MTITGVPFASFTWNEKPEVLTEGESGEALSRTVSLGGYRARFGSFGAFYTADYWCTKGHVVFVLQGELSLNFENGRESLIKAGEGFVTTRLLRLSET